MKKLSPVFLVSALMLTSCSSGCTNGQSDSSGGDVTVNTAVTTEADMHTVMIPVDREAETSAAVLTTAAAVSAHTQTSVKAEEMPVTETVQTVTIPVPASEIPQDSESAETDGNHTEDNAVITGDDGALILPAVPVEQLQ